MDSNMELDMMNLIMKRRSVRKFKEEKLSDEIIQKMLNLLWQMKKIQFLN